MDASAVVRREGPFFVAWSPELDLASQGPTAQDALANLQEAADLYAEDADAPVEGRVHFKCIPCEEGAASLALGVGG